MGNNDLHEETKTKIDKWIKEFSARPHFIEDRNLFDALYDCVCRRVDGGVLKDYLLRNEIYFAVGTNTDALICHAIDCYHAMQYLVWRQNNMIGIDIMGNGY